MKTKIISLTYKYAEVTSSNPPSPSCVDMSKKKYIYIYIYIYNE